MIPERIKELMYQNSDIRKFLIGREKVRLKNLDTFNYIGFIIKGVESHGVSNVHGVAYDGSHKIYLLLSKSDVKKAKERGYNIHPITELEDIYHSSHGLQFIFSWDCRVFFISQNIMPSDVRIRAIDYKAEQLELISEMELLKKEIESAGKG